MTEAEKEADGSPDRCARMCDVYAEKDKDFKTERRL